MYKVIIEKDAEKYIARLDKPTAKRIMNAIDILAENPDAGERLTNHETAFKYRVGSFRILYDVYESEITVVVVKVASRGQVYRK